MKRNTVRCLTVILIATSFSAFGQNPNAVLTLIGNDTVCAGSSTLISVDFSNGVPPYDFVYSVNGVPQAPQTGILMDPFIFPVTINTNNTNISLVSVVDAVGTAGTVSGSVLVHTIPAPTATLTSDTVTICAGTTDTLLVKFTGTPPFNLVYRLNGLNQPTITTSIDSVLIPVTPATGPAVYTLFSINDSLCAGTVSGTYRIEVTPLATAFISGTSTICAGESADLTIDFTGTGPFTVDYTGNNVAQTQIITSADPLVFPVSPTETTNYTITSVQAGGCEGTFSGTATIAVPPAPTAEIDGGGQICQGGNGTDITVTFTGVAPFTFVYSISGMGGGPQPPITTNQNTYTFNVNPSGFRNYTLVSMNDANCDGTVSGNAQVFVFVPASAELMGAATFCDSAVTNLMIDFNGSGPFTIQYTINGVVQPEVSTSDDPFLLPINITSTTTYELISVQSPGCNGIPSGNPTVTVNHPPTYSDLALNCNAALNNYTVTFTVLGATLPLTLTTGSGTFNGNQFTSDPIPQADAYNFVFHDANDCGDITISGPSTCNCTTAAGTMNLTPLEVCASQMATATYNGGFFDDGDDVLLYILHTNPALPLGTVIAWNTTPSFGFTAGMTAGTTYYISAIAGNSDGAGQIDLNDICLKVAQGTPVVFYTVPTGDIGTSTPIVCLGDSLTINVSFSGTPPFSFTPQFDAVAQPAITGIMTSTYAYVVHPTQDMVITLNNIGDVHCTSGTATGNVDITVFAPPSFGVEQVTCDYVNSSYTITFGVTGTPPYNLNGLLATFNGSTFTSLPIPFGTPYEVFLTDANNCGEDTLTGLGVCSCLSNAGTMSQTQVTTCSNDTLTVAAATSSITAPGDTLWYILHTNAGTPLGTILAWSTTPSFTFAPPMQTNVVYYISSIVGEPDASGQVNLNDPCLSVATGTPVLWRLAPTATLTTGTFNICPGGLQALLVTLTGTPSYTLTYTSNGDPFTVFPTQNQFGIAAQLQQSSTFVLTSVTDANGCSGTVSGTARVNVHPAPVVINLTPTCNLANQTYVLEFDVINGDTSTVTVLNLPGTYDPLTGHFISDPIPASQAYNFTVRDTWNCGTFTASNTVDCSCVTNAGTLAVNNFVLCPEQSTNAAAATGFTLEPGDTLVYFLVSSTSPTSWTILGENSTPVFSFDPATMSYETTYYIVAAAGDILAGGIDLNDPCFSSASGPTVVWRTPVTATLSGADTVCVGASATLQVTFTGSGPYSLTYNNGGLNQVAGNITQNPFSLVVTPTATSTYTPVSVSGAGACVGSVAGNAPVQVNPLPTATNVVETCDLTTETVVVTFNINGSPGANFSVSGLAGTITGNTFTSQPSPGAQPYLVTITDNIGCSNTLSGQPACVCTSNAGALVNPQNACLPNGTVSAQADGNATPDADDITHYFLSSDPNGLPGSIITESATPQFSFQTGMTAGTTYYIVVGVGTPLNGNIDFNDPCLSLSAGAPVVFHDAPTATISGLDSICPGQNANFTIQFTGQAPFKFNYAINGIQQPQLTSPANSFTINTNNVQHDQVFTITSVQDAFCSGTFSGEANLVTIEQPTASLSGTTSICLGDSTLLTLNLSGGTAYDVTISGGASPIVLSGVQNGASIMVAPTASSTTYTVTNLVAVGNVCTPIIGSSATITTDQVTTTFILSSYNGFNISCPNAADGSIALTPTSINLPVKFLWEDGSTGGTRINLPAGFYQVTLTNSIGCTFTQDFNLQAPPGLDIAFDATGPVCFGESNGFITLTNISGGAGPYNLLLNGEAEGVIDSLPYVIERLTSGDYTVGIEDANGCINDVEAPVPSPTELTVNLGPDTIISFGDSIRLLAIHNAALIESFTWTPTNYLSRPDSIETWSKPLASQVYTFSLTDELGCKASDQILIQVNKERRVYIPNIMNPHSVTFNNIVTVWGGADVARVRFMRIFDRWGEMVFENQNFQAGQTEYGWNGQFHGEYVMPGVYVYVVEVEYIDGETEIFKGDVTVIR